MGKSTAFSVDFVLIVCVCFGIMSFLFAYAFLNVTHTHIYKCRGNKSLPTHLFLDRMETGQVMSISTCPCFYKSTSTFVLAPNLCHCYATASDIHNYTTRQQLIPHQCCLKFHSNVGKSRLNVHEEAAQVLTM